MAETRREDLATLEDYQRRILSLNARARADIRKVLTPSQLPRFNANADSVQAQTERIFAETKKWLAERQY